MHDRDTLLASVDPLVAELHEDPTRVILALCRVYCALVTGENLHALIAQQDRA